MQTNTTTAETPKLRAGTADDYRHLASLAKVIADNADELRELATSLGEHGIAHTADETAASFTHVSAVSGVRADEARLGVVDLWRTERAS